jgi:hypothetical protein
MYLHKIRYALDQLYYYSFDNLTGEQRLAFLEVINDIDRLIRAREDF